MALATALLVITIRPKQRNPQMNPKLVSLTLIAGLWLGGCAAQQAKLYNMKDGSASALVVDSPGASAGSVSGTLAGGAACHGSFSTLDSANAQKLSSAEVLFTDGAVAAVAVLSCDSGAVLRCTMARRGGESFSYGECHDQGGAEYSMVF
jgi:hypothetical protein